MPESTPVISVIGAGKMGLPIACHMANRGARVIACDIDESVVECINSGKSPISEPGVAELVKKNVNEQRLRATTDTTAAVRQSNAIIVIVPVLLTPEKNADLSIIEKVTEQVADGLQAGAVVIYETTMPVGTTRKFIPLLEKSGLKAGEDFCLVFSPERVKSLHVLDRLDKTPKIIGGLSDCCAQKAQVLYHEYLGAPVIDVGSLEAAEYTKLADMIYRDANIALSNELARYAETLGVDYESVRNAANTSGEAFLLMPGIGVGGHCTPIYPYFAIRDAEQRGRHLLFAELARAVNDGQTRHVLDRLEHAWQPLKGAKVLILGLGFRPEVKEHICSPAFLLRDELAKRNAYIRLHDSHFTSEEIQNHGFQPHKNLYEPWADVLILNTAHKGYYELHFEEFAKQGVKAVIDGRNIWQKSEVEKASLVYIGIGN